MPDQPSDKRNRDTVSETRIEPAGEFAVEHSPAPPKGPADKSIHRRRPLPPVPEKKPKTTADEAPDK